MLVGFGQSEMPGVVTGETLKAMFPSGETDITCQPDASGVRYCAVREGYLDDVKRNQLIIGAAGGAVVGVIATFLLTR